MITFSLIDDIMPFKLVIGNVIDYESTYIYILKDYFDINIYDISNILSRYSDDSL